jgi:hypothetical protein
MIDACSSAGFGGSNKAASPAGPNKPGEPDPDTDGAAVSIPVGDHKDVIDIPGSGSDADAAHGKVTSSTSADPAIATVGTDGRITGVSPGETIVTIVYEDGTTAEIAVTVTPADANGDTDQAGGTTPGDDTDSANGGCRIDGDHIAWKWPKEIQTCFDGGKVWDFTRNACTTVGQAKSFDCTWDGIAAQIQGFDTNFTPDWDKKRLKIISCGERTKTVGNQSHKTIIWQYVMLPEDAENGACDVPVGGGIAIGCFEATKQLGLPLSDSSDFQKCIDG